MADLHLMPILARARRTSSSSSASHDPASISVGGYTDESAAKTCELHEAAPKLAAAPQHARCARRAPDTGVTAPGVERDMLVRGFASAIARHAYNFHVSTTATSAAWEHFPPPAIFSENTGCHGFHRAAEWRAGDRDAPAGNLVAMVADFVDTCFAELDLSNDVVVYALILIERFARTVGLQSGPIRMHTIRPLVFSALNVARKLRGAGERRLPGPGWCAGVVDSDPRTYAALVSCEATLLKAVGDVTVDPRTFAQYYVALRQLHALEHGDAREEDEEMSDVSEDEDEDVSCAVGAVESDACSHCTTGMAD